MIMIFVYVLAVIAAVHLLFLVFPVYREEIYLWYAREMNAYELFQVLKPSAEDVIPLWKIKLKEWQTWAVMMGYAVIYPLVFLRHFKELIGQRRSGSVYYSEDGKTLLKADSDCYVVRVRKGTEKIAEGAFDGCRVRFVYLPDTVRCLERGAFFRAHYLEKISLPDSLTKIGESAFRWAGSNAFGKLKIKLPRHLHTLGDGAFAGCDRLCEMVIRGDFKWREEWLDYSNPFSETKNLTKIKCYNPNFVMEQGFLMSSDRKILFLCTIDKAKVEIPEDIEHIARGAFSGRSYLKVLVMPMSVRSISEETSRGLRDLDGVTVLQRQEQVEARRRTYSGLYPFTL